MLSDNWVEKTVLHKTNVAGWDFAQKLYVQLDFQENLFFLKRVSFHHGIFDVTNFKQYLLNARSNMHMNLVYWISLHLKKKANATF